MEWPPQIDRRDKNLLRRGKTPRFGDNASSRSQYNTQFEKGVLKGEDGDRQQFLWPHREKVQIFQYFAESLALLLKNTPHMQTRDNLRQILCPSSFTYSIYLFLLNMTCLQRCRSLLQKPLDNVSLYKNEKSKRERNTRRRRCQITSSILLYQTNTSFTRCRSSSSTSFDSQGISSKVKFQLDSFGKVNHFFSSSSNIFFLGGDENLAFISDISSLRQNKSLWEQCQIYIGL